MKIKIKTTLSLLILAVLFFSNCQEKVDDPKSEPVVPVAYWKKVENINEGIFNGKVINNKFHAVAPTNLYFNLLLDGPISSQAFPEFTIGVGSLKYPVSEDIFVSRTDTEIFLFPSKNLYVTPTSLKVNELDPSFNNFSLIPSWHGEALGLNKLGTALIPYKSIENGKISNNPSFYLINSNINIDEVTINDITLIKNDFFPFDNDCYKIESFDNFFLAHIGNQIFRISNFGEFNKAIDIEISSFNVFYLNSELIIIAVEDKTEDIYIYKSDTIGETWSLLGKRNPDKFINQLKITGINDQIIGFNDDEIFKLNIESNTIKIEKLENYGLENGLISSISLLNNKVITTVICNSSSTTNCGVFYKPIEDFFVIKK